MSIFGLTRGVVDSAWNSGSKGSEVDGSSISSETDARIEGLVSGTGFSMCVDRKVHNTAQYPVNQRIVVGEPVVSKDHYARGIEHSYIKCEWGDMSGGNL